jgi:hypothetical protein
VQIIDVELPQKVYYCNSVGVREARKHVLQDSHVFSRGTCEAPTRSCCAIARYGPAKSRGGLSCAGVEDHRRLKLDKAVCDESFESFENPGVTFIPSKSERLEHARDTKEQT